MNDRAERGASLVELTVILPTLLIAVLAIWQSALIYHAKSQLNYATFEAARAGSLNHANVTSINNGLAKGLVGYYGGGLNTQELATRYATVLADLALASRVEILSPVRESFEDYASAALQSRLGVNQRVIPNLRVGQITCPDDRPNCNSDPQRNRSGQSLADANLLKLRITYGIPQGKQLPLAGRFINLALLATDDRSDPFRRTLLDNGRIPVVSHVTVRMQSEPYEQTAMVSRPGPGNNGNPQDPGTTQPPGDTPGGGNDNNGNGNGGNGGNGNTTPPSQCPVSQNRDVVEEVSSDVLFAFDSAQLSQAGRERLDRVIQDAAEREFLSLDVTGYTDQIGNDAYNEQLSRRRAQAVRDYLMSHGFPNRPINVEGRGERDPRVDLSACPASGDRQIACLAPNRRVTLVWRG